MTWFFQGGPDRRPGHRLDRRPGVLGGVLWSFWAGLKVLGSFYSPVPPEQAGLGPGGAGGLPGPAHPERVHTDVPLTDLERALARELFPFH